ncbi:MAG: chorismate-binding protein [Zetaproteobacteria bacterium]|nr:chorismate-binding protein [Zetaproteobacteria bacterium]
MLKNSPKIYKKRFAWPNGAPSPHAVFSILGERCCAILENPLGRGKHFIASTVGESRFLPFEANQHEVELFFNRWRERLVVTDDQEETGIQCIVYAAYEASALIEPTLPRSKSSPPMGAAIWLHSPVWTIDFDCDLHQCTIYTIESEKKLEQLTGWLLSIQVDKTVHYEQIEVDEPLCLQENLYTSSVEKVKDYIAAGDIFQANIARYWYTPFCSGETRALYAKLREVNPAPFSCYVEMQVDDRACTIISASPERLFRLSAEGVVETRPIAGTRRRDENEEDQRLQDELLLSEKERAEHIMLVDLERNDLGRIAIPGSVCVNECMSIEKYSTVQHIVSNIKAQLDPRYDVIDLLKATFPGGTITGCPKVRCMQIIHEQENNARGPYTGSLGYIAWNGSSDLNILIRTFWHENGILNWAAGAGIVADSDAMLELEETSHKAAGLIRALKITTHQ